jgi:threonine/homoserine/homoserine lactone efflux protein
VGPLVAASPGLGITLRLLVGLYLLWVALRLWHRRAAFVLERSAIIGWKDVFVTTLLNPKAIVFAIGIIPFGSAQVSYYIGAFLMLVVMVASAWILIGVSMGRVAKAAERSHLVPRAGAAATAAFALLLVLSPFFH